MNEIERAQPYQVAPSKIGLRDPGEVALFNRLLREWYEHLGENLRRENYYYQRVRPSTSKADELPEDLRNTEIALGWPTKAVDMLANRSVLKGINTSGDQERLDDLIESSGLVDVYRQAVTSQLIDSCAFLTVSRGDDGHGVIVGAYPATAASAIWDQRHRRIRAGMAVTDTERDDSGQVIPTWVTMYTDAMTCDCRLVGDRWEVTRHPNPIGRPLMEVLHYRDDLNHPMGRSRITSTVRTITDRALRLSLQMDTAAYFYTYPQRYLIGIDKNTAEGVAKNRMDTYLNRLVLATPNKNGEFPSYGQLPQMSMQPFNDQLQALAKLFSGETSIPMASLGISFDNPSSADAIYAQQSDLINEAEWLNKANGAALESVARMMMSVDGEVPADVTFSADFADPVRPSMSARSDFAVKVASVNPGYAETSYFWSDLGYSPSDTRAIMAQTRQASLMQLLRSTVQPLPAPTPAPEG